MGQRVRWPFVCAFVISAVAIADAQDTAPVDLLQTTAAQIVVSSASSAGLSGPSRMIDGRLDSAWCSRSGELVGAWIAIRVPEGASVTSIELVPGYVRNDRGTELWSRNHRIRRVAVSRDGAALGEFDLDPARPELQSIPVSGPAGLHRIEVRATEPGATRSFREACVTELRVMGRPGSAPRGTARARVVTFAAEGSGARVPVTGLGRARSRAITDRAAADALAPLVAGEHVGRVTPTATIERSGAAGRVVWIVYAHDTNDEWATRERMERGPRRRERGDCSDGDTPSCAELRLARVSFPADGSIPVMDADVELADDACEWERRSEMLFRDLDGDEREEMRIQLSWSTHPVCPCGDDHHEREAILDADSLRVEYQGDLAWEPGCECEGSYHARRRVEDADHDGHPELVVASTDVDGCPGIDTVVRRTYEERFRWDPATDAFVSGGRTVTGHREIAEDEE